MEFSREELLAHFCNRFEPMLESFLKEGFAPFHQKYYQYWLHSKQKVTIREGSSDTPVWIMGLTPSGYAPLKMVTGLRFLHNASYLKAHDRDGNIFELHPDGNSFDFFQGLIKHKLPVS